MRWEDVLDLGDWRGRFSRNLILDAEDLFECNPSMVCMLSLVLLKKEFGKEIWRGGLYGGRHQSDVGSPNRVWWAIHELFPS